jgi:hypothetical protein
MFDRRGRNSRETEPCVTECQEPHINLCNLFWISVRAHKPNRNVKNKLCLTDTFLDFSPSYNGGRHVQIYDRVMCRSRGVFTFIREEPGSNLDQATDYPDLYFFVFYLSPEEFCERFLSNLYLVTIHVHPSISFDRI